MYLFVKPPLQFYLLVMHHEKWDRIDIVTYADTEEHLNPVIPALQSRNALGELPGNVHIHTVSAKLFLSYTTERVYSAHGSIGERGGRNGPSAPTMNSMPFFLIDRLIQ